MEQVRTFIRVDQYTINMDRIDYIERSEEWSTIIHFTGGRSLELGEDSAKAFMAELERVIGKIPSWQLKSLGSVPANEI